MKKILNPYHFILSLLGAIIYRNPSRKLKVIGVTGTKGKTTVIELINAGFEGAGKKTAIMSSIRRKIGDKDTQKSGNSMPGRFALQKFLSDAVKAGCEYALIEVTSEGVVQHRHRNIEYDAGVLINLHPEHIESHGSFEKYRKAKTDFFSYIAEYSQKPKKYFFINKDDENASYFIESAGDGEKILFSKSELKSGLEGEFNKWNIGAAEAVLKAFGVASEIISRAFSNFSGVAGRMEFIQREPFTVVVDYAHTPDSLRQVYEALRSANSSAEGGSAFGGKLQTSERKLICVLGSCGGGRDKWKRPKFGEIAAQYCKEIILTDEDPYDENPDSILDQIESGFSQTLNSKLEILNKFQITKNYWKILDRRKAIEKAISLAKPGDTVVITGKGSEKYIHVAGGKLIPWSDKETVKEALSELR